MVEPILEAYSNVLQFIAISFLAVTFDKIGLDSFDGNNLFNVYKKPIQMDL